MQKIAKLTSQQNSALNLYKKKWQLTSLDATPVNADQAISIIKRIHRHLSKSTGCEIYFVDSPYEVAKLSFLEDFYPKANWDNPRKINNQLRIIENDLSSNTLFCSDIFRRIWMPLSQELSLQVEADLYQHIHNQLHFWSPQSVVLPSIRDAEKTSSFWKNLKSNQHNRFENLWRYLAEGLEKPDNICSLCCDVDFYTNELGCVINEELWQLLQDFANHCGWTFFFYDFCFACHRPTAILFDEQMRVHAENQPAIRFRDGLEIFVENGSFVKALFGNKSI
jgi:hypothetical protein